MFSSIVSVAKEGFIRTSESHSAYIAEIYFLHFREACICKDVHASMTSWYGLPLRGGWRKNILFDGVTRKIYLRVNLFIFRMFFINLLSYNYNSLFRI